MSDVEKIQAASAELGEMQDALAALQVGLATAEELALVAEEARRRSQQLLVVAVAGLGLLLVLNLVSARRRRT